MSYIAFWVSEEDKSNNKKNPAPSLSREAIYLTAYTHQHRPKQVSISKKRKNSLRLSSYFRIFFNKFHQFLHTHQDVTTTLIFNHENKITTNLNRILSITHQKKNILMEAFERKFIELTPDFSSC